jgi:hypothetical protein
MSVSELWIYWETRGALRDNMALERSALARPLIAALSGRVRRGSQRMEKEG